MLCNTIWRICSANLCFMWQSHSFCPLVAFQFDDFQVVDFLAVDGKTE